MHEMRIRLRNSLSAVELTTAWAVLLKDYVGSSNFSFLATSCASSESSRRICLDIGEQETLAQLVEQVQRQLPKESYPTQLDELPPFQTHLHIVDTESGQVNGNGHLEKIKHLNNGVDTLVSNGKIDFTLKCSILAHGREIKVIGVPNIPFCSDAQALRILHQFEHVLHQVDSPREIWNNNLVYEVQTASEWDISSVSKWNSTIQTPEPTTALQALNEHVTNNPDAAAVNAWDGDFTYTELDRLSTAFASYLTIATGIGPGNIVPLCFEKSKWTVVAIVSVIKTGAAFVLLDENLPEGRLQQIAEIISRETIVAVCSASQKHRAELVASHVLIINSSLLESTATKIQDRLRVVPHIAPADLLYIVFTSGSTGVPKAAMLSHNNICAFTTLVSALSDVTRHSRVLALASYAYDVSLGDIFISLLTGACLCIPSSWECKNDVGRVVQNYQITRAMMTPSVSKMLHPSESSTLKVLDLCGEPCSEDAIARWRGTGTRVMNTYGPAECTVTTVLNYNVLLSSRPTIIGTGLGASWIVDPVDNDRLTPVGGIGELVLEGSQIGLGYLHDDEATRRNFFEDAQWMQDRPVVATDGHGRPLYRTGDLVRYTEDGDIDYIGRRDLQVKIRGQRVELGEVAAHLQELMPSSTKWCPEVVKLQSGAELLVVFLVLEAANEAQSSLRRLVDRVSTELQRKLPPSMVPSAYAIVDNIPLSLSGKIDHAKLRQMGASLQESRWIVWRNNLKGDDVAKKGKLWSTANGNDENGHVHGASNYQNGHGAKIEERNAKLDVLRHVWSVVLDIDATSIHPSDTFFSHGGESLAAIKFVSAAAKAGVQLDVATIFAYPRFSDLATKTRWSHASMPKPPERFSLIEATDSLIEISSILEISIADIEDAYPCTPLQEGLIAAESLSSTNYVGRGTFGLPEDIDQERFIRAWERVATTHQILRTRIVDTESNGVLQVVLHDGSLFSGIRTQSLASYIEEDSQRKLGLGTKLCHCAIVHDSNSKYFVLTMHHAIYDGWTLSRIGAEVFRAYQGIRIGQNIGFNVFVKHINSLPLKPAEEFWIQQLAGPATTVAFPALPTAIREPRADSIVSKSFPVPLNAHEGVSIPSLLRAAWALIVSRLSSSDDVVFGATVSGRNIPVTGIEDLIGPTISAIPVRFKIDNNARVDRFVEAVQKQALDTMPFENLGLRKIRSLNANTREGSKFQTLFIVDPPNDSRINATASSLSPSDQELKEMLEGLDGTLSATLSNFNEYSLMIIVTQKNRQLQVKASYDSRVLNTFEAELLLDQFAHVAEEIGRESDRSLRELELASESDVEKIWQWNAKISPGRKELIHDIIANTIKSQPQAQAIAAWDGGATYSDVDNLSSRLCRIVKSKGVGRGSLVPICMEKSKWMTVAMLAILKTGAGFVAMDVRNQPKQRLKVIVQQVKGTCIVTAGAATDLARELCEEIIVCEKLSEDMGDVPDAAIEKPSQCLPSDTAFVVFTSGSTGVPKGIVITHENFCSTVHGHARRLKLTKDSRIYDFASYSFDIAVHNALMALSLGGCVCVPSDHDRENDIEGSFERLKANWADITPSVARLIDLSAVPGLRTLVLSGEAVSKDIVQQWGGKVNLINAYGPAECQICTIQDAVTDIDKAADIGHAVGCATWIVDVGTDNLLPVGATGELVIEGPLVSPGYLNASNHSFIRDPAWLTKGTATVAGRHGYLYRTGDLARYRADGTIVFMGRAATQVKINGQRIELSEVEFFVKTVASSPREVVADVVEIGGINVLTVYMVTARDGQWNSEDRKSDATLTVEPVPPPPGLLQALKNALPVYMIPGLFLKTSHIPLTATGKVNRKSLKDLASDISWNDIRQLTEAKVDMGTNAFSQRQLTIASLWSSVLKIDITRITTQSNFFQLGGDSISAMRLVKQSGNQGLSLTVADIFRHSQLDELSNLVTDVVEAEITPDTIQPFGLVPASARDTLISSAASVCSVPRDAVVDIYPCTAFQEAVFALTAGNSSAYVQHTLLRLRGDMDVDRVLDAWNAVIEATNILRTRLMQSEDAQLLQVVISQQKKSWKWYENTEHYLGDVGKIPMGLGNELSSFGIVGDQSTSPPSYILLWTMHHAIYDAWTMDIILHQVSEYYYSQSLSTMGPNYNVFVDFLQRQEHASTKWWEHYLSGASNASFFPKTPMSLNVSPVNSLTRKEFDLPQSLPPGYSPAVLLRASWAILMARHTGGESVVFGETRLGRNVPIKDMEKIPGPTIASAPIFLHVDREKTVKSLLDTVREDGIRMQEFEHLGLQNISRISDDTRAACNFQTLLVFLETEYRVNGDSIFEVDDTIDDIRNFNNNYLLIYLSLTRTSLVTQAVFRKQAIPEEYVDVILHQLHSIFSTICDSPTDMLVRQIDMASEQDLSQIWYWNATPATTVDAFIHELIGQNAQKYPEELAVIAHDGQMTYKELDQYSDNLASQLIARGIGLNTFVPLCFEKSVLVPAAMLAVIKTGAAFWVMDVSYPESRLKWITESLGASWVLSSPSQISLAKRLGPDVLVMDQNTYEDATLLRAHSVIEHSPRNTDRLMYVCFTSGSTGVPKGVMVSHKNLASAAVAQTRELDFVREDRVYDFSSHAFDANIWHFYLTFIIGACVCIPSQEERTENLAGSITNFKSTALFLTPSVARTLDPKSVPSVKRLYLGGEAVTPLDVSMWKDSVDLWGAYGPTETTPLCLFTRLFTPESASNIGRGVGVRSWIVNPSNHEELMAIGAIGEMVNEGPLVTLGYHDQAHKTEKVFIEDPQFLLRGFKERPGRRGRLYKTGDLVRYRHDGTIQYLGRADTQVKLRGQRVEYGEIEYHLKGALPHVTSVCEVILHPSSHHPMLVAFCALSTDVSLDKQAARAYLSKRLPPYMVPEFFLVLPDIPRNASGKIDRLKLRSLGPDLLIQSTVQDSELRVEHLHGPLTEVEALLGALWATALGQKEILLAPDTEFADVGGDSIAAMKLSNLSRKQDLGLTVANILRYPKLSSMALAISTVQTSVNSPNPFSMLPNPGNDIVNNAAAICGVLVADVEDIYPATPLQTELVALTLKQPQAYIKRSIYEIPAGVNVEKLMQAWDRVLEVNAILRTRFVEIESLGLVQVVIKGHRWSKYRTLNSYLEASTKQSRDLGSPLAQLAIIDDTKIAWTIHHALYDEWSTLIIDEQLRRAYQDRIIYRPPDFSLFVRYTLSQDHAKAQLFWQTRLAGCTAANIYPPLPSPSYQVQPSQTFNTTIKADIGFAGNLQARIHAAWALIVSKISGSNDVVFAATLAGRNVPVKGIEQMVGPTITPVPIRIELQRESQQIQELLHNVEKETVDMAPYQHIGMKNIELINDDTRAASKVQTLIVITPSSQSDYEHVDSIKTSSYEATSNGGEAFHSFALVLFVYPTINNSLDLQVIYDPAMLDHREVERLTGRLENVIASFNDKTVVSEIDVLGKEDLEDIYRWNSHLPLSSHRLLHHVILEGANKRPEKTAIDAWDCKLSYSQVDKMSDNLSIQLHTHELGRGSVIPILSPKSGYVPVAALAVLKVGGSFMPLDATQPLNRLEAIVDQVRPKVILTSKALRHLAINLAENVVLIESCLESAANGVKCLESGDTAKLDDTACILFTSGTTGTPKGVMQTHRALSSAVEHQTAKSGFTEKTRAFEFASYSFDVSWNMIFKVLTVGGTLVVPSEEERNNDLSGALMRSSATLTELTASVARLLDASELPNIETLILSGEPVNIREFADWIPQTRVVICYGPSECTSVATMNPGTESESGHAGIGKGCGCLIWLVDPHNHRRLMPVGAVGEILIDGPIVGKGYYNNEKLTDASYVSSSDLPWRQSRYGGEDMSSGKLFLSGDLARYDENGNLHFVSRKDSQVKLRGQRIELEEVQYHISKILTGHVDTVLCCILGRGDNQKLAAFLIARKAEAQDVCQFAAPKQAVVNELGTTHKRLEATLPKYMVPSVYYFITTIPRTNNGKVDRKRLVELADTAKANLTYRGRTDHQMTLRKPSTTNEKAMQELWAIALGISMERIGADDHFFTLNGDSISAMRLVAAARRKGFDLRVEDVFATPTLSEMSMCLGKKDKACKIGCLDIRPFELLGDTADVASIRSEVAVQCDIQDREDIEDVYPCTPLQESMMAATIRYGKAFVSMRLYRVPNNIDEDALRKAWTSVVHRHRILRTRLVDLQKYGLCQAVIKQSTISWDKYDSMNSFLEHRRNLDMGPATRLTTWSFIRRSHEECYLVWTIHHATYDGWSLPLIEDEVLKTYSGATLDTTPLDIRPLVKHIRTQRKEESIFFWCQQLAGAEDGTVFPPLPYHNYDPIPEAYMERTIAADLGQSSRTVGGLSGLLYGSWSAVVAHLTGSQTVSLGTILTGRNAPIDGIDRLIGPAVTTVPILVDVNPKLKVREYIARIQGMTTAWIPHEGLGIRAIRSINNACRAACNFQTVLVIQPPRGRREIDSLNRKNPIMEELDETEVEGFPNQHSVLNQYGLMIEVLPIDDKMTIRASFDENLIPRAQIDRLINQWEYMIRQMSDILRSVAGDTVTSLDFTNETDLADIWIRNKDLPLPVLPDRFVCQTIEVITRQQPEALAIDAWDGTITYHRLHILSSRLAHHLISCGIGRGCYVPLLFRKSMWANVSMLAVLNAGGSFVPLDADHPEGYLRAIMQPLNADVILCAGETADRAGRLTRTAIIVNETLLEDTNNGDTPDLPLPMPHDIAYAVFTSGSTGAAKGVRITHENLATAIHYQAGAQGYQINQNTRSLDSSSYSFDACVCNFFYTITQGGCLCIPSDESLKGDIGSFIRDFRVNWAQLVPSVARTLDPALLPDLKTLVLTGEAMSRSDIETWGSQVRLVNAYGPTECTILCTISPQISDVSQLGVIGYGHGANLWLTEIGNPDKLVSFGAIGEILIEGPLIGAGYLGPYQYPLVENLLWLLSGTKDTPGRRGTLFRTGDQGRYLEDGSIVLIGRIGSEIKLRGQRVDLQAIEYIVSPHVPRGLEVVVEIVHINFGAKDQQRQMLVVFVSVAVVPGEDRYNIQQGDTLETTLKKHVPNLKSWLNDKLPAHFQPEAFIPLPTIPKTSSSKIDRRRLKEIGAQVLKHQLIWIRRDIVKSIPMPPSTTEEVILASMWADILRMDSGSISRDDDFFQLGGDSLGVMRLTTKAHERGLVLKSSDVFANPKLALLAQRMTRLDSITDIILSYQPYSLVKDTGDIETFIRRQIAPTLKIDPSQVEDVLPANGFQVDYMHNQEEPLGLQYAYLDIGAQTSWSKLVEACRTVVQTFQSLRARFLYHQRKYYQIILRDAPLVTEVAETAEQITTFSNKFCPADCRQAQVSDIFTKITLVTNTGSNRRRVILRLSHMQNDGWCTVRILQAIATAFNDGNIEKTPDWSTLLYHRALTTKTSYQYWQSVLNGSLQLTSPLIYKHGGEKVRTLRSYALPYFHDSRDNRRTRPTVVVNVAWALVLQTLANVQDVVFGNVTTGRNGSMPGLDSVIGPCVNMLPFRLQLGSSKSSTAILSRQQQLRNLVEASARQVDDRTAHEGLDWDDMVARCTSWPSGSRYTSAVHFRNMAFEPELRLGNDHLSVTWYELVAMPHWTTVLVYPENNVLRLWLLANPAEIGEEGADEILHLLSTFCEEIIEALRESEDGREEGEEQRHNEDGVY